MALNFCRLLISFSGSRWVPSCLILLFPLVFSPEAIFSQSRNLIKNGGFEQTYETSRGHSDLSNSLFWFNPTDTKDKKHSATPDHLTEAENATYRDLQHSFQPKEGKSCAGIITYLQRVPNFREYLSIELEESLETGIPYTISFWISNGYKTSYGNIATNGFGFWLSEEKPAQKKFLPINATPQWKQKEIFFEYGWSKIEVEITPNAALRYLTFGNFLTDDEVFAAYHRFDVDPQAYLLIDEVSVFKTTDAPPQDNVADKLLLEQPSPEEKNESIVEADNRKVEVQHQFKTEGRLVKVKIYDDRGVDGDIVSVSFNGKVLLKEYLLTKKKKSFTVEVTPGMPNQLVLFAHNLGSQPPNTAAFELRGKGEKRTYKIHSDLGLSGAIQLSVK